MYKSASAKNGTSAPEKVGKIGALRNSAATLKGYYY